MNVYQSKPDTKLSSLGTFRAPCPFFEKMLTIISRKPRSAASTGFVYKVRTPDGSQTEIDEHDLISCSHGLEAIEAFEEKHTVKPISPSKRQKVNTMEPVTLDSGPGLQERVCVRFNGKWKAGKVVDTIDGSQYKDNHPRFTIQYDDGWSVKDRLTLPWYIQRLRSGASHRRVRSGTRRSGARKKDTMTSTATQTTDALDLEDEKEAWFGPRLVQQGS